jgi:glucans biosynthesis protein
MLKRRALGLLLVITCAGGVQAATRPIDFGWLKAQARERARTAYVPPPAAGEALVAIDPARLATLAIKPQRAPWSMWSRFVPLPLAPRKECAPTAFYSIQASGVHRVDYVPDLFDWAAAGAKAPGPAAAGFCGFDLLYPAAAGGRAPLARFMGDAWQAVGAAPVFGAQALVAGEVDADGRVHGLPFREFWLVRPAARATQLRIYALAESAALTAAVQIDLVPGAVPRAEVSTALYPRSVDGMPLLAALGGQFAQGEQRERGRLPAPVERHSVDGLAIHTVGDGWIWRPFDAAREPSSQSFTVESPRGFGLLQRDRAPAHYAPGAIEPQQPDVWLLPKAGFGRGQLRLLESPYRDGDTRNVVAGFVPDRPLTVGEELSLEYTLLWASDGSLPQPGGWVTAMRSGAGDREKIRRFAVEFGGPALAALPPGVVPQAIIDVGRGGTLRRQRVVANPYTGGWRLQFDFDRESDGALPLRAYLLHDDQPLSETWDYVDPPR